MDLSVTIGGVHFPSILSNAAGTAKRLDQAQRLARSASGAVRVGSYMPKMRPGNSGRTYWISADKRSSLNALGIPCPSLEDVIAFMSAMADAAHGENKPLIASIAGNAPEEYGRMAVLLNCGADILEVNAGCPNVWVEGKQKPIISYHPKSLADVLTTVEKAVGSSRMERVGVKVSPYFYDPTYFVDVTVDSTPPDVFDEVVQVIIASGVSHVVTMNTIPRVRTRADDGEWAINSLDIPEGYGGLAGPTVKEVGLAEVRCWRMALPSRFHVIGVGGVESGEDVLDYLDAGASAAQVGTAFYDSDDPRIFERMIGEYIDILTEGE